MKISVVLGTRPEAIKLAPVIRELRGRPHVAVCVVATAQHRELLDQALGVFGIVPDVDLSVMVPNQSLTELTARVLDAMHRELTTHRPDAVMVQGDTTTVMAASIAAFYEKIPVAHVEAGLRSHDTHNPFPEEMNRRVTGALTRWHFAPTARAGENLRREGVAPERVFVTGNTIVDALKSIIETPAFRSLTLPDSVAPAGRRLLVTLHRRESWGEPLAEMCAAIRTLCERYADISVVLPVHLNPAVRSTVESALAGVDRVRLVAPLDYFTFLKVMQGSTLVLTDSGGVQEEAPVFGRPVLVLRENTERPEAIEAGVARLIGTSRDAIVNAAAELLTEEASYRAMAQAVSPFGDGCASRRIADVLTATGGDR